MVWIEALYMIDDTPGLCDDVGCKPVQTQYVCEYVSKTT